VTGKGAVDFIPMWDTTSDIIDSLIFQKSSNIGIGTTAPAATLDINGKGDVRDTLTLFPKGTDSTLAINGTPFKIDQTGKVTFVSGQTFPGAGTITGITTASTSGLQGGGTKGTLNLSVKPAGITNTMLQHSSLTIPVTAPLTGGGSVSLGNTGTALAIKPCSPNQVLLSNGTTWSCAAAGTGTVTGVTAGTDLTGGGKSGNITLNLDTTKVPLLSAANTFVGHQIITGNLSDTGNINATGSITGQTGSFTANSSTASVGVTQNGSGVGLLSQSNNGVAVVGLSLATTGNTFGVEGATNTNGTGVIGQGGTGISGLGVSLGVLGTSSATNGTGVFGSGGTGVWGDSSNGGFAGVFVTNGGTSGALTIGAEGIAGNASTGAFGVSGGSVKGSLEFSKHALSGAGVLGDTGQPGGYAAVVGTSDDTNAGIFYNNSPNGWTTLYAQSDESSNSGNHVLEAFGSAFGGRCYIDVSGNLVCTGSKSAVVPVDGGARKVALYAVESPENWFEDFGSGKLINGVANITLESTFSQTVNTGIDYHVFLTPNGDCKGLYVTRKTDSSFEVLELEGGKSDIDFDYRIVARRKGYENIRLADKTKQLEPPMITGRKPVEQKWPTRPLVPPTAGPVEVPIRGPLAKSSHPNGSAQPSR
jgi:hypothetical protein